MPDPINADHPAVKLFFAVSSGFDSVEEAADFLYEWQERFEALHKEPQTLVLELARRAYPNAAGKQVSEERFFEISFEILDEVAATFEVSVHNFVRSMEALFAVT